MRWARSNRRRVPSAEQRPRAILPSFEITEAARDALPLKAFIALAIFPGFEPSPVFHFLGKLRNGGCRPCCNAFITIPSKEREEGLATRKDVGE
jgi:hypothetical protein